MFDRFMKLVGLRKQPCQHKNNYNTNRYLNKDGCPMNYFYCLDCGYKDRGPVIMGEVPLDWENMTTVRGGVKRDHGRI
jgi:hypothetical protein